MPVADDVGSGHLASRVRRLLTSAPVLAIDLGKYKCVACVDRSATEHTFQTMDTSRIARLISRTRPAVVVIEACSLAGWRSEERRVGKEWRDERAPAHWHRIVEKQP